MVEGVSFTSKEIHWCLSTTSKNISCFLNFPPNFYNKPTVTVGNTGVTALILNYSLSRGRLILSSEVKFINASYISTSSFLNNLGVLHATSITLVTVEDSKIL